MLILLCSSLRLAHVKEKHLPDLANYILASPVLRIKGAPKYLRLVAEDPL